MQKKYPSADHFSETGNWSTSKEFSEEEILKQFLRATEYERLAKFGNNSIYDLLTSNTKSDYVRINALEWLIDTLILITRNSLFAIVKSSDIAYMKTVKKNLKHIAGIIPILSKTNFNHITKEKKIILTSSFPKILDIVSEIKADMKKPLKAAGLIFREIEDFDPETIKQDFITEMTERG